MRKPEGTNLSQYFEDYLNVFKWHNLTILSKSCRHIFNASKAGECHGIINHAIILVVCCAMNMPLCTGFVSLNFQRPGRIVSGNFKSRSTSPTHLVFITSSDRAVAALRSYTFWFRFRINNRELESKRGRTRGWKRGKKRGKLGTFGKVTLSLTM